MGALDEFGTDNGTVWIDGSVALASVDPPKELRARAKGRPIVFVVDDEGPNRRWFAKAHADSFCVVSFSNRAAFKKALDASYPVDAVVTDLFFPLKPPSTDAEADEILRVFAGLESTPYKDVAAEWQKNHRKHWLLTGFDIVQDVDGTCARRKAPVPVFLYTLKSPLLLSQEDIAQEMKFSASTYWLMEKPERPGELNEAAARVQRARILSALPSGRISFPPNSMILLAAGLLAAIVLLIVYIMSLAPAAGVGVVVALITAAGGVASAFFSRKS